MVDDDVLGPDRGEAIAAMFADPLGEARREGREFEVGPVLLDQRGEVGDAEEAGRFGDQGVAGVEALADQGLELVRDVGLELQPDDPAAPPALDRAAEVADQVLGLLLDLDVAVADDPEGAAAEQFVAREERWRSGGGSAVSIGDVARRLARQADEARQRRRHHQQLADRLAVGEPAAGRRSARSPCSG